METCAGYAPLLSQNHRQDPPPLSGQSMAGLCRRITAVLAGASIELEPDLLASGPPFEVLLNYLRSLQAHGARLMV